MTERLDLYKCNVCGNLVEVILPGDGQLVCCSQPMALLKAHAAEAETEEKHVPVCSITGDGGTEIRVGSVLHPMSEEHYIQFIETVSNEKSHTELQYYSPGDSPIMVLSNKIGADLARTFCNIHGLWESKNN